MSIYKRERGFLNALFTLEDEKKKAKPSEAIILACELAIKHCGPLPRRFTDLSDPEKEKE